MMKTFATILRLLSQARHSTRAIWIVLLAMHVPALIAVGGSILRGEGSFSAISVVGLLLTVAFFVLKCLDVPFLRLHGRGMKIAFLLVCAFVHRGAVTGEAAQQFVESTPLIAVAGAVAAGSSRRVRQRVRQAIKTIQRSLGRASVFVRLVLGIVWHAQLRPRVPIYRAGEPARGPPVLTF